MVGAPHVSSVVANDVQPTISVVNGIPYVLVWHPSRGTSSIQPRLQESLKNASGQGPTPLFFWCWHIENRG